MKRYFLCILLTVFFTAHANAGIFEYYLWAPTQQTQPDPDTIESLNIESTPTRVYNTWDRYHKGEYYWYNGNYIDPIYSQPVYVGESYYDYIRHKNGYYSCYDISRILSDELRNLTRERDDIDDTKRYLKQQISDLKRYTPPYYRDTIRDIERQIDILEDRERYVEDRIDEVQREKRNVKNCRDDAYYYHGPDRYSNLYYADYYDEEYCFFEYDNEYYPPIWYYSGWYYTSGSWHEICRYPPNWVNPDLNNWQQDGGYIYIR